MIITGKKFSKPAMSRVKNGDVILPQNLPDERKRLDLLLQEQTKQYNRSTLQNFIKSGYVSVDGKVIKKPNAEITVATYTQGERKELHPDIVLRVPEKNFQQLSKDQIIYEDDNVLAINKPAGLLSMAKGEFTTEPTLEDYGLLVHRLDRNTSGVVILAKNPAAQSFLRKQFQERKAHKVYYAIIEGTPKLPEAKIDLPIARNLKHPTTFMVDPKGKPAETIYRVLQTREDPKLSLLELKPISGRTHQLRVHLKYLGCPILGDRVYGNKKFSPAVHFRQATTSSAKSNSTQTSATKANLTPSRLFLHAGSLEITIPGDSGGERVTFTAPLPPEFEQEMNA